MAESNTTKPATQPAKDKGVLCVKCDHLNPPGSLKCDFCEADLFTQCRHCGQRTQEALPRCSHCGQRLRRHWRQPVWWKRFIYGGSKLTLPQIVVLVVIAIIAYFIIFGWQE